MKLKKGDEVEMLSGKDRAKRGVIMRVLPKDNRVIVEGVNVAKKHQRQTKARVRGRHHRQGHARPCRVGGPGLPPDGAVRVGYQIKDDGTKVRVCKRCGREL